MKKRILLLFIAMIGMATSVGWAQGDGTTTKLTQQTIDEKLCIFANGNPVTVTASESESDKITITVDGTEENLTVANTSNLFGGSYGKSVPSSTIEMTSGTIRRIYGGGYGTENDHGDVTGTASITISGGTITNILSGGGNQYAKTEKASIKITGTNTKVQCLYAGGVGYPATKKLVRTWEEAVCGTKEVEINITDATLTEGLGCGGGQGYTYTGKSTVIINKAILGSFYGTLANGYANDINATLTGCTFKKLVDNCYEFATINRGAVNNASFTFDGCTFESHNEMNAGVGPILGWDNSDTSGDPRPAIEGNITWKFINTNGDAPEMHLGPGLSKANVEVTGAKTKLIKFTQKTAETVTTFSIEAGKTWTLGNGLSIEEGVTFTNNGTLTVGGTYTITNAEQLATAVSAITEGGVINLAAGQYTLSEPLVIDKAITLQSASSANKAVIKGCVAVKAEGATIKDLAFEYVWKSAKYSDKTGIAVFGNSATITGNTFTTSSGEHGTNGIVFYPNKSTAANYLVTDNTFSFAKEGSTAIMVRENFKSTSQIPKVNTTAILPNGSVVDASMMEGKNTFTSVKGLNYCRLTGDYSVLDGTGAGDGAITQKYLYAYTNTENLADVLTYSQAKSTINLSSVTSANMLAKLNEGDKKELTAGICILCSDATVYTDETSAQQSIVDGAIQYIKLDGGTYSLETPAALTVAPTIATKPTASTIEAGQPLSASILTGGEAKVTVKETEVVVNGVFSWKDPSAKATVGTNSYDVVFTPSDLTKYEVVNDIKVEIENVKQYYTVTIGKCDNGKIEVADGNSAGKYEDKKVLSVKAIPNEHYDFSAWGTGITGDAINGSYTVSKNDVLTATFVAKEYKVTIGKNVKVTKQDGTSVSTSNQPYGTVLNVVAAPTEKVGSLKALTCNDKEVINNTVTVDGALNIQAVFDAVVPSTYRISLGESVKNGKIQLFDENGNAIAFGSALSEGTVVSVVTVPDPGYELDGSATAKGATFENGKFTVAKAAVTVSATFKPKKYTVTTVAENATITLDKSGEQEYGTSIKITKAKAADDYKLLAVVVNGKEIAEGESFIVKGDTKVNAVVQKLPDVVFTDVKQIYTYNKEAQAFVVRTVPAGISGITITYKQGESDIPTPTDAGTYRVFATLGANSSYASMTAKEIGTLTIDKAPYPAVAIPAVKDVKDGEAENEYHWKSTAVGNFRTAYYKLPSNLLSNYREPEFVIPSTSELENNLTKVTLGEGSWVKTRSTTTTVSLTLNASGGSVSVWNGDAQVTNVTSLYAGQKLTLKAIPADAKYSTHPEWSDNVTVDKDGVASITLPNDNATVIATFAPKDNAPFTPQNYTSIYTGTAFGTNAAPTLTSDVPGWVVSFEQDGVTVNEPTAVGSYTVKASRSEDNVYKATTVTVGTLHITEATAEIIQAAGTDITTIQTLNQSAISGTTNVEGTFSWVNPDVKLGVGTHEMDVLFTPTDNNYVPVTGKATVIVTALASEVAVRTIELTESDPANGNGVVLTLNGTEVTAGTTVKAGDKLTATFSAKEHYTASAKINGASYTSGNEYEVKDETGNVTIAITYTQSNPTPTPNPEPDDDVINVTGVSLDVTSKTLAVGESFALKATVKPADADNKKVSWSSSDATIASVDKDGNVKALKAGTCKITATTEDGDYTATCDVTVTIATGIDEILTANRIYTDYRQIIVEPTTMLEVLISDLNGRIIYNGRTAEKISVSVSGGMYIVRLIDGKRVAATKVIVK